MSQQTNAMAGTVGAAMASGPALAMPFYESSWWLSGVAILGIIILLFTALNSVLTFRENLRESRWNGEERRRRENSQD